MKINPKDYRPNVGMMILNHHKEIFVGKRIDHPSEFWQMPQGGIDSKEKSEVAALREMEEEIGTKNVEYLDEINSWLNYDIPLNLSEKLWNGKYRGQTQKWLAYRFLGKNDEINIKTKNPEFIDWKWESHKNLPSLAVPFKRDIYLKVIAGFKKYIS